MQKKIITLLCVLMFLCGTLAFAQIGNGAYVVEPSLNEANSNEEWSIILNDGITDINYYAGGPNIITAEVIAPEGEQITWSKTGNVRITANGNTCTFTDNRTILNRGTEATITASFVNNPSVKATVNIKLGATKEITYLEASQRYIFTFNSVTIYNRKYNEGAVAYTCTPSDACDADIQWSASRMPKILGGGDVDASKLQFHKTYDSVNKKYVLSLTYTGSETGAFYLNPTLYGNSVGVTDSRWINGFICYITKGTYEYTDYKLEYVNGTYNGKTLEASDYTINMGTDTVALKVTAKPVGQSNRVDVPNEKLEWSTTSWNNVRVISGYVTGKKLEKNALVTVTLKNGELFTDNPNYCLVNVVPKGISIRNKSSVVASLVPGCDEIAVYADVTPAGANADPVEWETNNWNVCSLRYSYIENGGVKIPVAYIKCKKVGTCRISCKMKGDSSISDEFIVNNTTRGLYIDTRDSSKFPIAIKGNEKYIYCNANSGSFILDAKFTNDTPNTRVKWSTSDWNNVRAIGSSAGCEITIKGINTTPATITCTDSDTGETKNIYIKVKEPVSMKIFDGNTEVTSKLSIPVGTEKNLIARCYDEDGVLTSENKNLTWSYTGNWNSARFVTSSASGSYVTAKKAGEPFTVTAISKSNPECAATIQCQIVK